MGHVHTGHHHGHSHSHHIGHTPLDSLGSSIFVYDPLSNAVIAVAGVTAITQLLIALSPPLSGPTLAFLVAFAEGGMLATIFLHMLPELEFTRISGIVLIGGFLFFVGLDKVFRILSSGSNAQSTSHSHSHSHAHSHSHSHSHVHSHAAVSAPQTNSAELRQRKPKSESSAANESTLASGEAESAVNMSPWLNVVADSLHNVTDGLSLAISFHNSPSTGFAAFLVMCCHEIPHQFGDFALLINTGTSKSTARKAQLVTAVGTLLGCLLGSWFGSMSTLFEELVTPLTAGVFLYVATVGVLPELLETESHDSRSTNAKLGFVQLAGIISGIGLLAFLD